MQKSDSANSDWLTSSPCAKRGTCNSILSFGGRQPSQTARGVEVWRALAPGRSSREDEEGQEGSVVWLKSSHQPRERSMREDKARRQEGAGKPGTLGV